MALALSAESVTPTKDTGVLKDGATSAGVVRGYDT